MLDLDVAAEDATKGTHAVVVRAKGKFNEVEVEDVITFLLPFLERAEVREGAEPPGRPWGV
jgi:hypothetical protein